MFAKPFAGDLTGHRDGVFSMAKHPGALTCLITGACDGGNYLIYISIR